MTFVSFAQNFEDVMLWRALKHVPNGTYVDVGANDPIVDSVSKAFYQNGWRGIHIEPVTAFAEALRRDRPDEAVLQVALGEQEGVLTLNVFPDTGLSTAVDAHASRHEEEHGFAHMPITVPVLTLKSALRDLSGRDVHWLKIDVEGFEENVLRGWDSTALRPWIMVIEATIPASTNVDYAGWEPIVLGAGYRFVYFDGLNRFYVADEHPELVAAFSAPPNVFDAVRLSGLANSELCRGLLIKHDAERAILQQTADATVAQLTEQSAIRQDELDAALARIATLEQLVDEQAACMEVLQGTATGHRKKRMELEEQLREELALGTATSAAARATESELAAEQRLNAQLSAELSALREFDRLHAHIGWMQSEWDVALRKVDELNQTSHQWWTTAQRLTVQLDSLYASHSWRLMAPLRGVSDMLRWLKSAPRRGLSQLKPSLRGVARLAVKQPVLKSVALRLLAVSPALEQRARRLLAPQVVPNTAPVIPESLDTRLARELSPRAQDILEEINKAIAAGAR